MRLVFLLPATFLTGACLVVAGAWLLLRALFGKDLLP